MIVRNTKCLSEKDKNKRICTDLWDVAVDDLVLIVYQEVVEVPAVDQQPGKGLDPSPVDVYTG